MVIHLSRDPAANSRRDQGFRGVGGRITLVSGGPRQRRKILRWRLHRPARTDPTVPPSVQKATILRGQPARKVEFRDDWPSNLKGMPRCRPLARSGRPWLSRACPLSPVFPITSRSAMARQSRPPMASREPRRLLLSAPFQSASGASGHRGYTLVMEASCEDHYACPRESRV
jgi:hypothetical protein